MHSCGALDRTGFFRGISGGDEEARGGGTQNPKSGFRCVSQGLFRNSRLVTGQMGRETQPGALQPTAALWPLAG